MAGSTRRGTIKLSAELLADIDAAMKPKRAEFTPEQKAVVIECLGRGLSMAKTMGMIAKHCGFTSKRSAFEVRVKRVREAGELP